MNFIWDIVLRAQENGIEKDSLFFWQAQESSPYYEHSFPLINQREVGGGVVEINALYRFSHIFQELLHPEFMRNPVYVGLVTFIVHFYDVLIHYLSEIDLRHGLNRREFYVRELRREVLAGVFGRCAAVGMRSLRRDRQLRMADELLRQMQAGSNLRSFRRAVLVVFPDSILYQSNFDRQQLLLYVGRAENDERAAQMAFLLEGFLPLGFRVRIFWTHHFGILGVDATMCTDKIALF